MNDKVAKRIRRELYLDGSKRNDNQYLTSDKGVVTCSGTRAIYKYAKRKEREKARSVGK